MVVVSALALGGVTLADDSTPLKVQGDKDLQKKGIVSVTDAQGNPIDLRGNAAPPKPDAVKRTVTGTENAVPVLQRGQAWWPYPEPLARDLVQGRTVSTLREEEIDVNGVVTIDTRDPQAAMQKLPKELLIDQSRLPATEAGYYLVKMRGLSRTQHEVDALEGAGAVLGEYLNVNTYIAKIPAAAVETVRGLPFVTYVGDYQPAYKISPRLGLEQVPVSEAIDQATGRELPWVLEVVLHKGATRCSAASPASASSPTAPRTSSRTRRSPSSTCARRPTSSRCSPKFRASSGSPRSRTRGLSPAPRTRPSTR
jgi:hypothetical protein